MPNFVLAWGLAIILVLLTWAWFRKIDARRSPISQLDMKRFGVACGFAIVMIVVGLLAHSEFAYSVGLFGASIGAFRLIVGNP